MWHGFSPPREADTSIRCKACGGNLQARRTCHEAHLYCPACRERRELSDYLAHMDEALERFLEALNCDRI